MTSAELLSQAATSIALSRAGSDPDYPRFHLAPPVGRLNDPNGLVVANGIFHAFYQFGPFFPTRKLVYWGHASSVDLTTWRIHPPAIAPSDWYDCSGVYSGGATIVDGSIWLHYTGNVKNGATRESYQCAVTTGDLVNFTKHPANPLIPCPPDGYTAHVRDPQILSNPDGFQMLLGAQRNDETGCILSYHSSDLVKWQLDGELSFPNDGGHYDAFGFMWECPNLLRVPDERTGEFHDVLIFCPQGVGPIGDSFRNVFGCGYVVGKLEGTEFQSSGKFHELDKGFEFYAPQAFRTSQESEQAAPILMAWLGNAGEDDQPSLAEYGWVHMMTIPRELTLRDGRLHQRPAPIALKSLGTPRPLALSGGLIADESMLIPELTGADAFTLTLEVCQSDAIQWSLGIAAGPDSRLTITFRKGAFTVDRSATRYAQRSSSTTQSMPSARNA